MRSFFECCALVYKSVYYGSTSFFCQLKCAAKFSVCFDHISGRQTENNSKNGVLFWNRLFRKKKGRWRENKKWIAKRNHFVMHEYSPCRNISEMIIHMAATKLNQLQNPRFFLVMFKELYAFTALIFLAN